MARNDLVPFGGGGYEPLYSLHREMNRLFDDVFRGGFGSMTFRGGESAAAPAMFNARMNVSEDEQALHVTVELPGVDPRDVDVSFDGDVLTIRGEKRFDAERDDQKTSYHYVERNYGSFQRALRLPFSVRPEEIRANFEHGVLRVTVPKSAQQARSHRIAIGGTQPQAAAAAPRSLDSAPQGQSQAAESAAQPPPSAPRPDEAGGSAATH